MSTLLLTGWLTATYYALRAGGPAGILRALRCPHVPRRYKVVLALCALPIPGPVDEIVAAVVLAKIARKAAER
jgi:hypothetical protein